MLAIQAEEGEGLGHPFEPQPPPFTAQPTNEEPIPNVTSEPIPNVPDEAIYEEWDDRVERATTTAASLDAEKASGGSPRCQEAMGDSIAKTRSECVPTLPCEKDTEDSSKHGRMIEEIDQDAGVTLVTPIQGEDQPEDQLGVLSAAKVLADAAKTNVHTYTRRRREVSTGNGGIITASALMLVSTAGMIQEVNISIPSPVVVKDKEVESSKRATKAELNHEGSKRQKTNEASGSVQEQSDEEEKELSSRDLQDDLVMLWNLVKERLSSTEPTDDKERTLWVKLKRLFEPNTDDTLWKLQRYMHDLLKWRLYDTCGVHHVSIEKGIDIFMLVEKEYPLSKGVLTLMLVNKLLVEQHSEMANELLRKIFI
ncbi:hypothetical protein Tco_0569366 [Tanacetum coccineum]